MWAASAHQPHQCYYCSCLSVSLDLPAAVFLNMRGNTRGISKHAAPNTPPILPPTPISPVTTGVSTACGGYTVCGGHNFCVSLCQPNYNQICVKSARNNA